MVKTFWGLCRPLSEGALSPQNDCGGRVWCTLDTLSIIAPTRSGLLDTRNTLGSAWNGFLYSKNTLGSARNALLKHKNTLGSVRTVAWRALRATGKAFGGPERS